MPPLRRPLLLLIALAVGAAFLIVPKVTGRKARTPVRITPPAGADTSRVLFCRAVDESATRAADAFPALRIPNSALSRAFLARFQQAYLSGNDPIFLEPDWPMKLATALNASLLPQP